MHWLIGHWTSGGVVAAKAALMYGAALVGLRIGERRTLAQWTLIDFITAIAMGAIVGRTATANTATWVVGAIAIATLIAVHRVVSLLRFTRPVGKLVDHRVRVLVAHGELRRHELRTCAVTENDLFTHLRQQGYFRLDGIRYVLYETKGNITVVPEPPEPTARDDGRPQADPPLVASALANAVNFADASHTARGDGQTGPVGT